MELRREGEGTMSTKVEEVRKALEQGICAYATGSSGERLELGGEAHVFRVAIPEFEQAVREEALAPREPSPGLARAEKWLRDETVHTAEGWVCAEIIAAEIIAAELDRLRAEVARRDAERDGEEIRVVYITTFSAVAALGESAVARWQHIQSDAEEMLDCDNKHVYEVRMFAKKVCSLKDEHTNEATQVESVTVHGTDCPEYTPNESTGQTITGPKFDYKKRGRIIAKEVR